MPGFEIQIEGLAELQARLEKLKGPQKKRIMNRALKAGGAVYKAAMEDYAPERPDLPSGTALPPGALKHDIRIATVSTPDDADASLVLIGPGKRTVHAARLVEYGHAVVSGGYSKLLASGKRRGPGKVGSKNVPPHPWARPAFEQGQQGATDAIVTSLKTDIGKLDKNGDS